MQALQTPTWCKLLQCIGDSLMVHLLLHTSIFVPLGNSNFLQLTGRPVFEVCTEIFSIEKRSILQRVLRDHHLVTICEEAQMQQDFMNVFVNEGLSMK